MVFGLFSLTKVPVQLFPDIEQPQIGIWINLTFGLETDMQETVIEVISRLNRLPPLPRDADPPVLRLGGGGGERLQPGQSVVISSGGNGSPAG